MRLRRQATHAKRNIRVPRRACSEKAPERHAMHVAGHGLRAHAQTSAPLCSAAQLCKRTSGSRTPWFTHPVRCTCFSSPQYLRNKIAWLGLAAPRAVDCPTSVMTGVSS